jgi:sugar phosphate isomerase/epimerase
MNPLNFLLCLLLPAALACAGPAIYPFGNAFGNMPAPEAAELAKELGYQGIGSVYPNRLAETKDACEAEGLKLFSIYVGGKVNADGFHADKDIPAAIEMLKGTGALVELNVQRGKNPNDEQAVALVRHVADLAKEAGLKVVIYPHANFHIERFGHALEIAKASGRDNVGVAFNLCHFLKLQKAADIPAALTDADATRLLWSVSVCGADLDGTDWNTLIRPLDEGSFDQSSLLWTLRRTGYAGAVGLQCYNIRLAPREHLSRSVAAWRKHLHSAGYGSP